MIINTIKRILFTAIVAVGCSPISYRADKHLSDEEKTKVVAKIIRYLGKMPDKADHSTRFDSIYDAHYEKELQKYELIHFYPKKNTYYIYFSVIRSAPSIKEKYVATAGKFRYEYGVVKAYEEVFRTWRMEKPELLEKLDLLFEYMIYGRDLKPYYPENSGKDEYIEFPNNEVTFDKKKFIWESSREDVMEPYYKQLHTKIKEGASDD